MCGSLCPFEILTNVDQGCIAFFTTGQLGTYLMMDSFPLTRGRQVYAGNVHLFQYKSYIHVYFFIVPVVYLLFIENGQSFFLVSFPARKVAILKCCQLPCVMRRTDAQCNTRNHLMTLFSCNDLPCAAKSYNTEFCLNQ